MSNEQVVWEPLPDGLYCGEALAVAYKGTDIGIKIDDEYPMRGKDWVNNYEWLSDAHVSGKGTVANEELKSIRLCRATTTDSPDVASVPSEVIEALKYVTRMYLFSSSGTPLGDRKEYAESMFKVNDWLSTVTQEGQDGK